MERGGRNVPERGTRLMKAWSWDLEVQMAWGCLACWEGTQRWGRQGDHRVEDLNGSRKAAFL